MNGRPVAFVVDDRTTSVDTFGGDQSVDGPNIGGGKANFSSASSSMGHHAADTIGPSQHFPRLIDVSIADQVSDSTA